MFNLDTNAAKTEESANNRINESGIYAGVITRAEWTKGANSQAEFLGIDFKDDEGREANYMNICFKKRDGENSFGYNIINKIMACCSLRQLNKAQVGDKLSCPELVGARVSFALQAEHDWFKDKTTGEYKPTVNMIISTPFKADSGQSAKEVLEQSPAELIKTIKVNDRKPKDKPVDTPAQSWGNAPANHAPQQAPSYNQAPAGSGVNYFDDDIPFAPIGLQHPGLLLSM